MCVFVVVLMATNIMLVYYCASNNAIPHRATDANAIPAFTDNVVSFLLHVTDWKLIHFMTAFGEIANGQKPILLSEQKMASRSRCMEGQSIRTPNLQEET